jgi:Protein of unknown function (DUF1653)
VNELHPLPQIPLAQYRHYKGGLYEVLGVARHSESHEPMVVYRPLYGESGLWVRPFDMFVESVVHEGKSQPRFSIIGSAASPSQEELVRTVERMEAVLSASTVPHVDQLLTSYHQLVARFEQDLGANSRDAWLARASALMLVQAVHRLHGAA